ncbi:galectin-3b isoform X4 [Hippocampus zosterae]|uniref:galectin-3b isoform X4 n=1 Tax=Hippocampus zosterae TaxID=109293 RepID=UPI00223D4AA3|nr:galectin-3b isoform X4 [Hippocampus zosterae]
MNLSDALDDGAPSGAGTQSAGSLAWPQQPNRPGAPANPTWGGGPGGQWPGGQPAAGGAGGGAGQWPGGAGGWPGQQPAGGGAGGWPGQQPGQQPAGGWPGGQPPATGGGQWPSPSKGSGDWPAPSPGTAANTSLTVPYSQKIPNGLRSGSVIHIKGSIKPKADKVTVDLSTGSDLAFHFNPRFNESGRKVIVRNSKIGGRWGSEERNLSRFPFTPGQPFELKIECTSSAFVVSVQGSHLLDFKHRGGNPGQIRSLDIYNDLSLSHVSIQ